MFRNHYEARKKIMQDSGVINIEKVQDFCKMIEELDIDNEQFGNLNTFCFYFLLKTYIIFVF